MKKFVKQSIAFITPVILFMLLPWIFFLVSGELTPQKKIIEQQLSGTKPILYGKAYISDDITPYKIALINKTSPKIIAIGSSRIMQIRNFFFNNPEIFFNAAGGEGELIIDMLNFLQSIEPKQMPSTIIITFDQHFFHTEWFQEHKQMRIKNVSSYKKYEEYAHATRNFYKDILFSKKYTSIEANKNNELEYIGIRARVNGEGFRNDGSYRYGILLRNPESRDEQFKEVRKRVKEGRNLFYRTSNVEPEAIKNIEEILTFATENNIHIIGILPPMPNAVTRELHDDPGYAYIFDIGTQLKQLFAKENHTFFDATELSSFGGTDDEMVDGVHGSERTWVKILLKVSESDPILKQYINTHELEKMMKDNSNPFNIKPNSEKL